MANITIDESIFGWNFRAGDWRPDGMDSTDRGQIALLVPNVGHVFYEGRAEEARRFREKTEKFVKETTDADDVYVGYVNPDVGADGYGIGVLLEFIELGAAAITWVGAAIWITPRIKAAVANLKAHFNEPVYLSREALQLLVLHDLCDREGLKPEELSVEDIRCITYACPPTERRLELQQIYAVHTITVRAIIGDWPHYAWTYLVTAGGTIVLRGGIEIPYPKGPRWQDIEVDGPSLSGLQ